MPSLRPPSKDSDATLHPGDGEGALLHAFPPAPEQAQGPVHRRFLPRRRCPGARYSFGYPACPDLAEQRKLLALLGADRIGVQMAEEDQLHPEQSTSAIVVPHPQAKYFSV